MDKKCPYCGSENDFFESELIHGIICNDCGVSVDKSRAVGYARGYKMGDKAMKEVMEEFEKSIHKF